MNTPLIDQDHIFAIENDTLVLRSLNSTPIRSLVIDALNKTKAREIQLSIGESFHWDIEPHEALRDDFDEVLFDMINEDDFSFDEGDEVQKRIKLVAVV